MINLDRSLERWKKIEQNAQSFDLKLKRVAAVDGSAMKPDEQYSFNDADFRKLHGKIALDAEIGCYFSHLKTLQKIAASPEWIALIAEDDICFTAELYPFVKEVSQYSGWDVIKLVNHRCVCFRSFQQFENGIAVGRCLHGPSGSSAAYLVTHEGARKLLAALQPMQLPYDVALERGWAGNYNVFTTNTPLVEFSRQTASTISIGGRAAYAKAKLPVWKRFGTLIFRTKDYIRRVIYGLKISRIKIV